MGRWLGTIPRLTTVLFAIGVLVVPAPGTSAAVARAADCPSPPVTIGKILAGGLACYGGQLLTVRAYVPRLGGIGGTSAYSIMPAWLDDWEGSWVLLSAGPDAPQLVAFVPPALGRCLGPEGSTCPFRSYRGRWATVSAHFDGPVAQTCRYGEHPPGAGFTKRDAVAECRQKLIVLSVGPADALPPTDTVAVGHVGPDSPSTALPWVATLALVSLLLATRLGSARRHPESPLQSQ